jgi:hypothetical protein
VGTLVCTVELDKVTGIKVTIENADAKITQSIAMNGTTVVISVKSDSAESTITQTAEKIAIACKQFEVTASETVTITSTKASTWTSQDTLAVKSAKDLTLTSDADVSSSGVNVKATGSTSAAIDGAGSQVKLESTAATVSTSGKLSLSGQMETAISGGMVEVKADGLLTVESTAMATFKGQMTAIQGSLVTLG